MQWHWGKKKIYVYWKEILINWALHYLCFGAKKTRHEYFILHGVIWPVVIRTCFACLMLLETLAKYDKKEIISVASYLKFFGSWCFFQFSILGTGKFISALEWLFFKLRVKLLADSTIPIFHNSHLCTWVGFWTHHCCQAHDDQWVKCDKAEWLTSGEWGCLLVSGLRLTYGQPNSWFKKILMKSYRNNWPIWLSLNT